MSFTSRVVIITGLSTGSAPRDLNHVTSIYHRNQDNFSSMASKQTQKTQQQQQQQPQSQLSKQKAAETEAEKIKEYIAKQVLCFAC